MAGFGRGSGRKKTTAQKRSRPTDDVSEYEESDQEYTEFEYWNNNVEVAKASKKRKEFAIASEPGKKNPPRGKKKLGGIEIREPTFGQAPYQGIDDDYMNIDSKRIGVFCQRLCIGERHVAVQSLLEESPEFALLFEQGHLEQICDFSEQTGYCMQLVRTFYLCGGHLRDDLGGPLEFTTTVRATQMKITPATVAAALGMETNVVHVPYLQGHLQSLNDWRRVVNGVCLPDTMSTGNSVFSKELRPEYRILNFIVCYNILPTMQTKIIRWERLLYMYLVGHPTEARGLNLNIPYLIWTRMTKDVRSTSQHERLPFPMIIMRILRNHNVNTHSTSYEHSLGTINETTIVKSGPLRSAAEVSSASRPFVETSEEDASVTSIFREQQRLLIEQERLSSKLQKISAEQKKISKKLGKLSRITKVIFDKLGCCSADIPPQDDDSD